MTFGNAVHAVMQHIDYKNCTDISRVTEELQRIVAAGLVDKKFCEYVKPQMLWDFFSSDIGIKLRNSDRVLREFKFSILEDASEYDPSVTEDQILLQGVVDCAIIDPDGITVLDFKTDRVTPDTVDAVAMQYKLQVQTYAKALSRIFQKEVVSSQLYFFRINQFVPVI